MSLITRCPACETMFKVVPDQLRISEGWVRCGQCAEIFNAAQSMVASDTAPATPPIPPQAAPPYPPAPEALDHGPAAATAEPSAAASVADGSQASSEPAATAPGMPASYWQTPSPNTDAMVEQVLPASAHMPQEAAAISAFAEPEPLWRDPPATQGEPPVAPVVPDAQTDHDTVTQDRVDDDAAQPSFLRDSAKDGFWQRKSVRWVLLLLALGLAVALALQVILQERNRIAQLEPGTRGLLAALCAMARCEIRPLQQIESVVIDGSLFGRVRGDSYRLAFSLRNTAPIDVAMPAIELSLTDTQDQALVRRVILPTEFGAPAPALAAGADWNTSLSMSVRAASNTDRIAGYRLLAFYP